MKSNNDNQNTDKQSDKKGAYSTDQQKNNDLPGYPHHPSSEDITRPANNSGKESLDENNISLPNVYDIPGQEHIKPLSMNGIGDTTASSDDEEDNLHGDSLDERDDDDDTKIIMGTDADVTGEDIRMLQATDGRMDTVDDNSIPLGSLDDTDEDGDPLNEQDSLNDDVTGKDLDVPGSEDDDADENVGEEDEENNYYSLGGDNHEGQEEDNYNS